MDFLKTPVMPTTNNEGHIISIFAAPSAKNRQAGQDTVRIKWQWLPYLFLRNTHVWDANTMNKTESQRKIKNKNLPCLYREWRGRCCWATGLTNPATLHRNTMILGSKTKRFWFTIRVHNPEVNNSNSIGALELAFLRLSYACLKLVYMSQTTHYSQYFLSRIPIVPYRLQHFGLINFAISPYFC